MGKVTIFFILFIKAQIKDTYSEDGKNYDKVSDIYWYVSYYDLVVDETGVTSVDVTNYDTPGHSVEVELPEMEVMLMPGGIMTGMKH